MEGMASRNPCDSFSCGVAKSFSEDDLIKRQPFGGDMERVFGNRIAHR